EGDDNQQRRQAPDAGTAEGGITGVHRRSPYRLPRQESSRHTPCAVAWERTARGACLLLSCRGQAAHFAFTTPGAFVAPATSHSFVVPSVLAVASVLPSGLKATDITRSWWALIAPRSRKFSNSHSLTSPSFMPTASSLPSRLRATERALRTRFILRTSLPPSA